jgi:two-component system sensor histidine kinase YesM
LEAEALIIKVEDDGVGMSEETAASILFSDSTDSIHGYGIKNINDRIRLYFGSQYGLNYISRPGVGTLVVIKIPALLNV